MDLIADANILFAALIMRNDLHLYAPEYIIDEFEGYRELIKRKTHRSGDEFDRVLDIFQRRIELVPFEEIKPFVKNAKIISPDIKDIPYIALALKLHMPIWSNDKTLKEKQKKIKVYSTAEIMML